MNSILANLYENDSSNLISCLEGSLIKGKKEFIITANSEIISYNDDEIKKILSKKENIVVCDGIALTKIASIKNNKKYFRIPGVDLTSALLNIANENKFKVYIYGSSSDNIVKLKDVIASKFSNIHIVGLKDGFSNNTEDIKGDILKLQPDIIIVGLGVPKQELFINSIINYANKGVFIGVGGSLDIMSGNKKRAPRLMIDMHLEWLYRIFKEPKRLIKFIKSNLILLSKVRGKND